MCLQLPVEKRVLSDQGQRCNYRTTSKNNNKKQKFIFVFDSSLKTENIGYLLSSKL